MEQETVQKLRSAEAKRDLVGAIHNSELYELLGFHNKASAAEQETWDMLMKGLEQAAGEKANKVSELAINYGNEREETGFRIGFHMAMRLCMEGLNGGVSA